MLPSVKDSGSKQLERSWASVHKAPGFPTSWRAGDLTLRDHADTAVTGVQPPRGCGEPLVGGAPTPSPSPLPAAVPLPRGLRPHPTHTLPAPTADVNRWAPAGLSALPLMLLALDWALGAHTQGLILPWDCLPCPSLSVQQLPTEDPCPSKRVTTLGHVPGAQIMPIHWPLGSRLTQPGPKLSPQVRSWAQPPVFCSFALCGPSKPHWAPCGQHFIDFSASDQSFYGAFGSLSIHTHTLVTHIHAPLCRAPGEGVGWRLQLPPAPATTCAPALASVFWESSLVSLSIYLESASGVLLAACGL